MSREVVQCDEGLGGFCNKDLVVEATMFLGGYQFSLMEFHEERSPGFSDLVLEL